LTDKLPNPQHVSHVISSLTV